MFANTTSHDTHFTLWSIHELCCYRTFWKYPHGHPEGTSSEADAMWVKVGPPPELSKAMRTELALS